MSEGVKSSPGTGPGVSTEEPHNLRGGIAVAVIALLFLWSTFYISSPAVPRTLSILLIAVGIATAAGLVPVRAPQDYYGGLVLIMLALLALVASAELPGQRGFAFGPGTAPRLFSGLLAFIGAAVTLVGVVFEGPLIEKYKLRGPALVILSIILFAAMIRPFGLIISTYLAFMVSILGSREMRWVESLAGAGVMTAFCWGLFVWLLNLPFQLWPQSNAHEILIQQFSDIFRLMLTPFLKFLGVM